MPTTAHRDLERQKARDRSRRGLQAVLRARMQAVVDAQQAATQREVGATFAFRQALIDLAAAAAL